MKFVAYRRVSRQKQAQSGLGLEAQEADIQGFAERREARIIAEYTEVESGKSNERPQLKAALHHAKVTGAILVIAKLDRLSRSASFTLALRDSGVKFVCCDMPEANDLTIGVLAVVAQAEAQAISRRTKDALQIARKRVETTGQRGHGGIKRLGKPKWRNLARPRWKGQCGGGRESQSPSRSAGEGPCCGPKDYSGWWRDHTLGYRQRIERTGDDNAARWELARIVCG